MFRKVMVANRGEIAVRILRTLSKMGIRTVAVASEADRDAPHALAADEVHEIGPPPAAESYLKVAALLDVARKTGCEAIHPGYGFLSENAGFAQACAEAGVVFIGPPAEAIRLMGSKTESRLTIKSAGIPVVPGFQKPGADDGELLKAGEEMGWPVLIKAVAGGGGKGMRVVKSAGEFDAAAKLARGEAMAAFGNDEIYLERFLEHPRHVEIQVFGDADGRTFHLGERECSIQRRHQKIIEEAPSPTIDDALRARMGAAAVGVAEAAGYRNAGTVEFLVDPAGDFYFLEMNTRLQVEHAVTEMVYGVDLVEAQVLTAAGETLPFDPDALEPRGHAIEARVYAENPAQAFLPQIGRVLRLRHPAREGVRVDSGLSEGRRILTHYDPLLAKVIAWGDDRETATRRLRDGLREMTVLGVTTNIDFLADVLDLPAWREARLHTGFLDENLPSWAEPAYPPDEAVVLAAEASVATGRAGANGAGESTADYSPWTTLGAWSPLGGK